jgi:hypothetical protein
VICGVCEGDVGFVGDLEEWSGGFGGERDGGGSVMRSGVGEGASIDGEDAGGGVRGAAGRAPQAGRGGGAALRRGGRGCAAGESAGGAGGSVEEGEDCGGERERQRGRARRRGGEASGSGCGVGVPAHCADGEDVPAAHRLLPGEELMWECD